MQQRGFPFINALQTHTRRYCLRDAQRHQRKNTRHIVTPSAVAQQRSFLWPVRCPGCPRRAAGAFAEMLLARQAQPHGDPPPGRDTSQSKRTGMRSLWHDPLSLDKAPRHKDAKCGQQDIVGPAYRFPLLKCCALGFQFCFTVFHRLHDNIGRPWHRWAPTTCNTKKQGGKHTHRLPSLHSSLLLLQARLTLLQHLPPTRKPHEVVASKRPHHSKNADITCCRCDSADRSCVTVSSRSSTPCGDTVGFIQQHAEQEHRNGVPAGVVAARFVLA